ncbi:hypothetical protein SISNIDRAFT_457179 [Sistotremastrum niveocremeum HHB9708]|uniref:Uncharacterized protein n=1 Tax=Sistotremastrum niveocremeum HHB9708 TaxID=1314777 RepID=A0A164RSP3_9AGAM|nr:hypothetical protein SISNIDRAFT_457179 [Sistotremastrum niveocremeum HHB9708]
MSSREPMWYCHQCVSHENVVDELINPFLVASRDAPPHGELRLEDILRLVIESLRRFPIHIVLPVTRHS